VLERHLLYELRQFALELPGLVLEIDHLRDVRIQLGAGERERERERESGQTGSRRAAVERQRWDIHWSKPVPRCARIALRGCEERMQVMRESR
jgi:hypothetical protein